MRRPRRIGAWRVSALALTALLLAGPRLHAAPQAGFGATNVVDRFASRLVLTSLEGPAGFESNFSGCCIDPISGDLLAVLRGPVLSSYAIQIYAPDGTYRRQILLNDFDDVEAICVYDPASNLYAVVEEARNDIVILPVTTNTTSLAKADGHVIHMGLGGLLNVGIEGLTWDAGRRCFYAVKEWKPAEIYRVTETGTNVDTDILYDAALITNLCTDLSDVHYDATSDHLLLLSHESHRIVETTLDGRVLDTLPVQLVQPEGLTLSAAREELYVIGEPNHYQRFAAHWRVVTEAVPALVPVVLSEPPEPATTTAVQVVSAGAPPLAFAPPDATVHIASGATGAVSFTVLADNTFNPPRDFALALTNAVQASLTDDQIALLRVVDSGRFHWSVDTLPGVGQPFRVTVTAQDTNGATLTGYTGPATLSLTRDALLTRSMLPDTAVLNPTNASNLTTRGLRFRPSVDVVVTHLRYTFGDLAGLWTEAGALLAVVSGPPADGDWEQVALTNPVALTAGSTYRVAASSFQHFPRCYTVPVSLAASFADGSIRNGCETNGVGFPNALSGTAYAVDIRYQVVGRAPGEETPASATAFTAGQWSGWLTITTEMANAILMATAGSGHTGQSPTFDVLPRPVARIDLPPVLQEGAGDLAGAGLVTVAFDPTNARVVDLFSSDTNALVLPASVTVTGGTDSATFDLVVPDNTARARASSTVFVYATATNHAAGTNAVSITDDDFTKGLLLRVSQRAPLNPPL